jgi:hypothetical protein
MLRRLLLGLVIGLLTGSLVAAALISGLGMLTFGSALFAYAFAAATGVLTGLVAGTPIWAKGGQIEAGLKAFFGALLAAGGMFAIRKWLMMGVDLSVLHAGAGAIGELPAASLPVIGAVLGAFYELDNTDPPADEKARGSSSGSSGAGAGQKNGKKVRVSEPDALDDDEAPAAAAPKKIKR